MLLEEWLALLLSKKQSFRRLSFFRNDRMLDLEDSVAVWEMTVDSCKGYLIVFLRFMKQAAF